MKKIALLSTLLIASAVYASDQRAADIERLQTSGVILTQIMSAPDRGIPDAIMDGAKCIAVIPSMLKASFIFGANYGKGVATCRTPNGWSAPAFFKVEGGSFGLQAGGQASDLVLIIRTTDGMQHLLSSKFKLGGDASAAAGPVGRDAQAATDLTLRAQVLTYSRARGLFLGISLNGAVIHQAAGDTQSFYRAPVSFRTILSGETPAPAEAQPFLQAVEKYAPTPRTHVAATASPRQRMQSRRPARLRQPQQHPALPQPYLQPRRQLRIQPRVPPQPHPRPRHRRLSRLRRRLRLPARPPTQRHRRTRLTI